MPPCRVAPYLQCLVGLQVLRLLRTLLSSGQDIHRKATYQKYYAFGTVLRVEAEMFVSHYIPLLSSTTPRLEWVSAPNSSARPSCVTPTRIW